MKNMTLVIGFLGTCLLLCVLAIGLLAWAGATIPDVLQNVAVGSLTGLAGVLARRDEPTGPPLTIRPRTPAQHRAEVAP